MSPEVLSIFNIEKEEELITLLKKKNIIEKIKMNLDKTLQENGN